MPHTNNKPNFIKIRGAKQHTLKDLNLDIPLNKMTVVTGVSGSGKSSLAFDTLFAEGQRRYIETFSPYVRQFLAQMDRPKVDFIDGVPPAVAVEQYNPVRTSRSTVGTMTEINDYLKLLFARLSTLICPDCNIAAIDGNTESLCEQIIADFPINSRVQICFHLPKPEAVDEQTLTSLLSSQGYTKFTFIDGQIEIAQDRLKLTEDNYSRLSEAVFAALNQGNGDLTVSEILADKSLGKSMTLRRGLHCPSCERNFNSPTPNTFSFNAPTGACDNCRGFGRVIGIDYDLAIPDKRKSIQQGAIKPWQTDSNAKFQRELLSYAKQQGIDVSKPWQQLTPTEIDWVIQGEPNRRGRTKTTWYGLKAFFDYWERKSYKMHVRMQLSKYRSYTTCPACNGSRLKPEALHWRLRPANTTEFLSQHFPQGINVAEICALPIEQIVSVFEALFDQSERQSEQQLLEEIRRRLNYLSEVGLGYLTLDRQTRNLSGGEVQRINLTTALGSSLTQTLFVLDEPSVGLHAQEVNRIIKIMQRLRDAGNTLVVVEHDPAIMLAADEVIDIGPGAGELGGNLLFQGTPQELLTQKTLTADYLNHRQKIQRLSQISPVVTNATNISLSGISLHNLYQVDVNIPLHGMTVISGVSGSGKSTLVNNVLYPSYKRWLGEGIEFDAKIVSQAGFDEIEDMILVDQSPIGKSARSNPASYVGAYDGIRQLFAKLPDSIENDFSASTFSFNSGNGRCPSCQGTGFEHIEMQFMSDVYLRCQDCDGTRFQESTLAIRYFSPITERSYNIYEVLQLTVSEALQVFTNNRKIVSALQPLVDVGLGYTRLGQPVPTLSGGEAQRLKLAKFLATPKSKKTSQKPTLFILDEPTTGLHMADVATLLRALQQLVNAGNALLIVEHHLDIINNADHLIELGPGAGSHGGKIIFSGTPELAKKNKTPTGLALTAHLQYTVQEPSPSYDAAVAPKQISVIQAREHNLKNLSVNIPHNQLVAITGVSGSGKSTLAFNILFAEGQRRYLESLNAFSRQFIQPPPRPEVDALLGMPPAIAIEQRTSRGGQKSTVATTTEIYHYLRQLFLTLGEQHCPDCQIPITAQSFEQIEHQIRKQFAGQELTLIAPLIIDRKGLYKELADWASNAGFSELWVDGKPEQTDNWPKLDRYKTHDIDLAVASIKIPKTPTNALTTALEKALNLGKGRLKAASSSSSTKTKSALTNARLFSTARACPSCQKSFAELDPRLFSYNSRHGSCQTCDGNGVIGDETKQPCPACHEQRLNPTALAVKFHQHSIGELCQKSVADLAEFFANIKLDKRSQTIGQPLVEEIKSRLQFLLEVGLDYLSLQRGAPTLSGGEAQRIRLASQIGNHMSGACYVLDEPTIGLHARDNQRLVRSLSNLVSQGNSVIVVEHDEETIRAADHIIDIGPGAGVNGGQVVTQGTLKNICKSKTSLTAKKLSEPDTTTLSKKKTTAKDTHIILKGATKHNLQNLTVKFPLHRFIGVAGVSGSGKSTLIRQVLEPNLRAQLDNPKNALMHTSGLNNIETVGRILEVDQTPIGRTPRSCPATYIGIWDDIRKQLSNTQEAKIRGWKPNRFSFNNKDGCCAECGGQGQIKIEMNFLPDVREPCQSCRGMRFNQETLQIKLRDKTAGEILDMPVDDALSYFEAHPKTHYALSLLQDIGLGYLKLGQPSPTLSGGEAQRIKLVTELSKAKSRSAKGAPHTLYILDEPTVGLHMADVDKLTTVLHRLVDQGHSVIVIEHNLDLLKACDWLIELGPEGGKKGGKIIAEGMVKNLLASKKQTPTLQFMR